MLWHLHTHLHLSSQMISGLKSGTGTICFILGRDQIKSQLALKQRSHPDSTVLSQTLQLGPMHICAANSHQGLSRGHMHLASVQMTRYLLKR